MKSVTKNTAMKFIASILASLAFSASYAAEIGKASFYGVKCNGGTKTASGRVLRDHELTAAHRTYRFGTKVRVTNLSNGKSVVVTITDRGPFIAGRIIDVTYAAADKLGFRKQGLARVKVEKI